MNHTEGTGLVFDMALSAHVITFWVLISCSFNVVWIVRSYLHDAAFEKFHFLAQQINIRLNGWANFPTDMSV